MTIWVAASGVERWGKLEANSFHICNGIESVRGSNSYNLSTATDIGRRVIVQNLDPVQTRRDRIDAYLGMQRKVEKHTTAGIR